MTTPDVPLRMSLTFELPGTPEQIWDAIATGNGMSSWFLPSEIEEREGGAVCFHMGDAASRGHVSGWEPPRRLEYAEPDWAALSGHDGESVTPLVTEFLVEAQSGGTCVLRVVSSAFGSGADWEQEFFDEMERGWVPFFDNLRLYLTHFPGQRVTPMSVEAAVPGAPPAVWRAVRQTLGGAASVGDAVTVHEIVGTVERIGRPPGPDEILVRVTDPVPGFLGLWTHETGNDSTIVYVSGWFFSDGAAEFVAREEAAWKDRLRTLTAPAA
jgi:uncharacterized protein YndB with AHSA1/START domain